MEKWDVFVGGSPDDEVPPRPLHYTTEEGARERAASESVGTVAYLQGYTCRGDRPWERVGVPLVFTDGREGASDEPSPLLCEVCRRPAGVGVVVQPARGGGPVRRLRCGRHAKLLRDCRRFTVLRREALE